MIIYDILKNISIEDVVMFADKSSSEAADPWVILLGVFIVWGGIALIVYIIIKPILTRRKHKKRLQKFKEDNGVNNLAFLNHKAGLSLPKDIQCRIMSFSDHIEIEANNMKFNLYKKDIVNAYLKNNVDIKTHYVSSAGDAIAAAKTFGAVGAAVAGGVKEIKEKKSHLYLILTYNKNNKMNYIYFEATHAPKEASILVQEIKSGLNEKKVVDL